MSKYHWIIDNGHGYNTKGKRSPFWPNGSQLFEWEFNRILSHQLVDLLAKNKIEHTLLVPEKEDIPLEERSERADNIEGNTALISIHGNAARSRKAQGMEVYTSPGQTKADPMASILLQELSQLGWAMRYDYWTDDDPDKEAKFHMLMKTKMPAMLSENGFYTNFVECSKMLNPSHQRKIVKAHFQAIKKIEAQL